VEIHLELYLQKGFTPSERFYMLIDRRVELGAGVCPAIYVYVSRSVVRGNEMYYAIAAKGTCGIGKHGKRIDFGAALPDVVWGAVEELMPEDDEEALGIRTARALSSVIDYSDCQIATPRHGEFGTPEEAKTGLRGQLLEAFRYELVWDEQP
jgi:hypothetical protein